MSDQRKYTVAEIDAMRQYIKWSYPAGQVFYATERNAEIEDRLRTYMQNGTEPDELRAMRDEALAQQQRMQAMQAQWS